MKRFAPYVFSAAMLATLPVAAQYYQPQAPAYPPLQPYAGQNQGYTAPQGAPYGQVPPSQPQARPYAQPNQAPASMAPGYQRDIAPQPADNQPMVNYDYPVAEGTPYQGTDAATSEQPAPVKTSAHRYVESLQQHISQFNHYPPQAALDGLQGTVIVYLKINRMGSILDLNVAKTSGHDILDNNALDVFRQANPFPAMPADYASETQYAEYMIPIVYMQ